MIRAARHAAIIRELRLRDTLTVTAFASRLGVSAMTVRRDLMELEAAGELVRTHGGASSLQPRQTATLGIVVPATEGYYAAMIEGASRAADRHGARLVLASSSYHAEEELRIFRRMQRIGVDGIILTPHQGHIGAVLVEEIRTAREYVVIMDREPVAGLGGSVGCVLSDAAHGAELAVGHLADLGHRTIALLEISNPKGAAIRHGFDRTAAGRGLVGLRRAFGPDDPRWRPGDLRSNVRRHLAELVDDGVTGVIVSPDTHALQLVQIALEQGIDVPGDLSVIAYNDEVARLAEVPLTAVAPPKDTIGMMSVESSLRALAHDDPTTPFPVLRTTLHPTLRIRESCAPPRQDR